MTQPYPKDYLKKRHCIEWDPICAEKKIAELKNETFLSSAWKKLKTFLKQSFQSTDMNRKKK